MLALKTWGSAAGVWTVAFAVALVAWLVLPEARALLRQPMRDAATWGVAANAVAMVVTVAWQRRHPWGETAQERAILTLAFGNVGTAALTVANVLLPAPLVPALPSPLPALALAAGATAAALAAVLPPILWRRSHGR